MSQSIARRRSVRARTAGERGPGAVPQVSLRAPSGRAAKAAGAVSGLRRRSLAAALVAYVMVGAFIGLATWKLTETAVETAQVPSVEATPQAEPAVAAVEAPQPAQQGPHTDALLAGLLEQQAPSNGIVGLYVRNLTTGAEASVNPNRVFAAASLYKLPIMVETIRQIKLGRISPEQQLIVQKSQWVPGSGVLQGRVGQSLPVKELLRLMIGESDNIAAMMLLDLTGVGNVNSTMRGLGMESTRVMDWRAQGANAGLGPYTTSPADMALLMDTIGSGRLVDQPTSDEALKLLGLKQASDLLSELLPWNVRVVHKWGEIPGGRHEAGIVFAPQFKYVVIVMTENVDPNGSPGYIRDLSKTIYTFFEQQAAEQQPPQQQGAQQPQQPQPAAGATPG